MSRDPQRLADVGADASAEDRLLAILIDKHRQGRPDAADFRALGKKLEAHAAPGSGGGLLRLSLAGVSVVVCGALIVSALRGGAPATPRPSEGERVGLRAETVAPALSSASPEPASAAVRAADALPESPPAVSVHSLPNDSAPRVPTPRVARPCSFKSGNASRSKRW
ncbi:MAG: hypothetical protein K0S65_6089 [Labilithrix sp.]|nr:hypothetical protein [Labilithrix sp.]